LVNHLLEQDIQGDVERLESITVKGLNRFGHPMTVKAKGWLARIFQHEIDGSDFCCFLIS
jgi:peptide deformylase